jgi:hypothetical protein
MHQKHHSLSERKNIYKKEESQQKIKRFKHAKGSQKWNESRSVL